MQDAQEQQDLQANFGKSNGDESLLFGVTGVR